MAASGRTLPFLNGIRAFEAAARNGSFVAAGEELHVSPAAVSRLVRLLEQRMQVSLFERRANRLTLTLAGRAYRDGLTPLLDGLVGLTESIAAMGRHRSLTVGVGPTFAIRWLIPRLAAFHRQAPGIEVRITTAVPDLPYAESWSCAIRLGDGRWPGLVAHPLLEADLTPVCVPALARGLDEPSALAGASLLRVAHAMDDWPRWLTAAGITGVAAHGPVFDFYGQALQAATDGLGIAMGIRPYIDDDLAAGRLVAPFELAIPKGRHWYLLHREARAIEPGLSAFRDWILALARAPKPADPGPAAARRINRP